MDILSQVHLNLSSIITTRHHSFIYLPREINISVSSRTQTYHSIISSPLWILNPEYLDFGLYPIYIYFSRINIFLWESQNRVFIFLRIVRRKLMICCWKE